MYKEKRKSKHEERERKKAILNRVIEVERNFFFSLKMATLLHETPNCFNDARIADDDAVKSHR